MAPKITIDQGRLRGSTATDIRSNPFIKFQGIPYAKPPLGKLRFKAPQPPEKWVGVYDATRERDICYSSEPLKNGEISGSEDCLYLNVYTKKIPDSGNLSPVLFWIHGGALAFGSGNEEFYGPDFLLTEDVVLVTINYRLGLLGFLSFEDPSLETPGNAGFKDQVMALKWVQNNISRFGGDPNNVTIFGESAGAASVHLLMLSPMAKGLFHKAIAQSGSALSSWATGTTHAHILAPLLNLEVDEKKVHKSLMEKSCEELFKIQLKMFQSSNRLRPVGLVIEKKSKEPFMDDEPMSKILNGDFSQVPFIIGYTSREALLFYALKMPNLTIVQKSENLIPSFFGYETGPEIKKVAKQIETFYQGGEESPKDSELRYYERFFDFHILYGTHATILNQLKKSKAPIYLYRMSVESDLNFFKKLWKLEIPGASHLDDVGYLFKNFTTPEIKPGSLEDISMSRFVKLWTNFAKYGNPTPEKNDELLETEWKPVSGPVFDFLDIGEELKAGTNPDCERMDFWKNLFLESPAAKAQK